LPWSRRLFFSLGSKTGCESLTPGGVPRRRGGASTPDVGRSTDAFSQEGMARQEQTAQHGELLQTTTQQTSQPVHSCVVLNPALSHLGTTRRTLDGWFYVTSSGSPTETPCPSVWPHEATRQPLVRHAICASVDAVVVRGEAVLLDPRRCPVEGGDRLQWTGGQDRPLSVHIDGCSCASLPYGVFVAPCCVTGPGAKTVLLTMPGEVQFEYPDAFEYFTPRNGRGLI